jgi:hypothetical protein
VGLGDIFCGIRSVKSGETLLELFVPFCFLLFLILSSSL